MPKIKNIVFRNIHAETTQPYDSAIRATTGPLTAGIFIGLPESPIDVRLTGLTTTPSPKATSCDADRHQMWAVWTQGLVLENVTVVDTNPTDNPYKMVGWNCTNAINVVTRGVSPAWPTGTCTRPKIPALK